MFSKRKEGNQISVFIGVGANLPDRAGAPAVQTCEAACRAIARLPGLSQTLRSRWFSSAPVPQSDQPRYINGVIRAQCSLAPAALIGALQALEQSMGRVRSAPNAARTLDLDIIDMDGLTLSSPELTLPHPRTHLRAFVLLPLRDVAPDWVHPTLGLGVNALLGALPRQDIRPL
jgi:2-amino-4-hydroxy-6-hydroxymethyldihydropteridine diphosphokinase